MKKQAKKFILDIAPLVRLPLERSQSFSYLAEKNLEPGTLVSIPLFHQEVQGIVLSTQKDFKRIGGVVLKPIKKVIEENFLDKNQLALAKFISDYYVSPLGIVLKSFVPQITKARRLTKIPQGGISKIILTQEQKKVIKEIAKSSTLKKSTTHLLFGPSGSGKTEIYIHSILEIQKRDPRSQALIILPELTLTPQAIERYGAYFDPTEIVILNSQISKGQFFTNWQKIKSGQAKIIIASRAGIFAPFQKLRLIVIDEEQDMSHKQWDMNPRYDARKVAEKLAALHNSILILGSATPRIESYYQAKNKKINLLTIPSLKKVESSIELVDMRKEYWKKNKFTKGKKNIIFSQRLLDNLTWTLGRKEQAILFINRQGLANFSLCSECHQVLKCPKCDRALSAQKDGNFICLHCNYKTTIFPKCPKCQNMHFESIGLGTQKIEEELKKVFPKAKVLRLDSQTTQKRSSQEKIYQDFKAGKADFLVGTQMITKGWDLPNLSLVGIIDTDSLFNIPDYFTDEKAFDLILQVAGRTNRPKSKRPGKIILQTFSPENKIYQDIEKKDFPSFFQKEMIQRKNLSLPPLGKLIKLIFQDPSQKLAQQKTEELWKSLSAKKIANTNISPASPAFVPKIRGKYRYQIIIKTQGKELPKIKRELKKLTKGWTIDIDPISLT